LPAPGLDDTSKAQDGAKGS